MAKSPKNTRMAESPIAFRYPTYPPEVEARRAHYEQIARAFNLLIEMEDQPGGDRLYIDLPFGKDYAPSADLVGTIQNHLYRLHLDINWFDSEAMNFLYVEMRLHCDLWRWKQKQDRPDEEPVNPAAPRGITALYARLGALISEVMEHEDCARDIRDALGNSWYQIHDKYADSVSEDTQDGFARWARTANAAERGRDEQKAA